MKREQHHTLALAFVAALSLMSVCSCGQVPKDARSIALAETRTLPGDPWAAANSPAGLSAGGGSCVGISGANGYLVSELNHFSFTCKHSFKRNGLDLAGTLSGFSIYLRQHYSLGYGRQFGNQWFAGVGLEYICLKAQGLYSAMHGATFKIGFLYLLSERVNISFLGINPFGIAFESNNGPALPPSYTCGISFHPEDYILLAFEVETDTEFHIMVKGAGEYSVRDRFFIRLGAISSPFRITSGVGFKYSRLLVEISTQYHSWLGFSPALSVSYHFQATNNESTP